ncbi:MAG: class I SAM-dependent methyltransferase [Melioribacteraceae bacterium]
MKDENFNLYSLYYNLLYTDKNYEAEATYVHDKLKKYIPELSKILELGTGTGVHADLLQKKGLSVTGIELSEDMAQQAREKGIECYVNDCSDFRLEEKFDAVISLFHVISYLTENEKLIKTFQNVYNHLNPGGVFLFDVWYSPAVYNLKPETRIKRIDNDEVKIIRLAEPVLHYNKNVVDVNYEVIIEEKQNGNVKHINETHSMRHFSLPELDLLATTLGFEILEAEEWLTGKEPSENTWGVCFILKRN